MENITTTVPLTSSYILEYLPETSIRDSFAKLWIYVYSNYTKFQIGTWGTLLFHEFVYFACCLPAFLFQFVPCMRRFKIQSNRPEKLEEQWKCFKLLMFNHCVVRIPLIASTYVFTDYFEIPYSWEEMPTWYNLVLRLCLCVVIDDTCHFFLHYGLHHKRIYKYIHKIHHQFQAPFGMVADYEHPAEMLILGAGTMVSVTLLTNHVVLLWILTVIRLIETVDIHSGYNIPYLNVLHLFPCYAGSKFHDFHHYNFNGNYASTFTWWDHIFGTDRQYHEFYANGGETRLKQAKNKEE